MKHVFDTNEVAHLWMHKSQSDARNGQGNFYFDGDAIYSYGRHFPIARHVEGAILLTTRGYSSTTSGHISLVKSAIHGNGVRVLYVSDVMADSKKTTQNFDKQIAIAMDSCFGPSGKLRAKSYAALEALVNEANEYAEWARLKQRWDVPATDGVKAQIEAARAKAAQDVIKAERKRKAEEKKRAAKMQAAYDAWRNGENVSTAEFGYGRYHPCALRLSADGAEIETSQGVSFPADHAKRGIELVRACKSAGREYHRNGHTLHLGHYVVDAIDADGNVQAGCHQVTNAEVERIATALQI